MGGAGSHRLFLMDSDTLPTEMSAIYIVALFH